MISSWIAIALIMAGASVLAVMTLEYRKPKPRLGDIDDGDDANG